MCRIRAMTLRSLAPATADLPQGACVDPKAGVAARNTLRVAGECMGLSCCLSTAIRHQVTGGVSVGTFAAKSASAQQKVNGPGLEPKASGIGVRVAHRHAI